METCTICLEEILNLHDENVYKTTCGHYFHHVCLEHWKKNTCPVCRQDTKFHPQRNDGIDSESQRNGSNFGIDLDSEKDDLENDFDTVETVYTVYSYSYSSFDEINPAAWETSNDEHNPYYEAYCLYRRYRDIFTTIDEFNL